MKKLGAFSYGDVNNENGEVVKKPILLLENGAKYEGEW
jgi:hypothetical protein